MSILKNIFRRWQLLLLFLLASLLLFYGLGQLSVFQVAEARNAECAREMLERNDLVVPTFNYQLRTDKPVFSYWAMMLAYQLFGVNEGSARFFSAICGLLTLMATYWFALLQFGRRTAFLAVLILLSSTHAVFQFRLATPDPYLIFFHTASLFLFWMGYQKKQKLLVAAMYVLLGGGMLAKGPVAVFLPLLTIVVYLGLAKKWNRQTFRFLMPVQGLLLFLLVAAPWFILVGLRTNGDWLSGFFIDHNMHRFETPTDRHGGPFVLTLLFVMIGLFPFSVFVVRLVPWLRKQIKQQQNILFVTLAAGLIILFYCFTQTRLINYTTTAYPFLAILIAHYLVQQMEYSQRPHRAEWILLFIFSLLIPIGLFLWLQATPPFQHLRYWSLFTLILPLGWLLAIRQRPVNFTKKVWYLAGSYIVFTFFMVGILLPVLDLQTPVHKRKKLLVQTPHVVAYQHINDDIYFYRRQPIPVFDNTTQLQQYLTTHQPVLVISKGKDFSALDSISTLQLLGKDKELFSSHYSAFYLKP